MKAVLISIKPKWCKLIVTGNKTVEVRKTKPKLETPFKVYIYCTNGGNKSLSYADYCGYDITDFHEDFLANGKVVAEFICDKVEHIEIRHFSVFGHENRYAAVGENPDHQWLAHSCLTYDEVAQYGKMAPLYGWHISGLKIYDEPKALRSFHKPCPYKLPDGSRMAVPCPCDKYTHDFDEESGLIYCTRRMKTPPQSWCYVEEQ